MPDYPGRPSHIMPGWVKPGAYYHVRIRIERDSPIPLTNEKAGRALLDSAILYHEKAHWYCHFFLLMPDHLHALLAFPPEKKMSSVIGAWKSYQAKAHGIVWQGNYFDHRIRTDAELEEKAAYIRRNPVVKGLCATEYDWPWVINCPT